MLLALIVACGRNREIGINNTLPWHVSADLKRFKQLTLGHSVLMGRKTHESIGRPLPQRRNLVISRREREYAGCECFPSLEQALQAVQDEERVFVIGGGEIYQQALPQADVLHVTEVHVAIAAADTFFPRIEPADWREVAREEHAADADTPAFAFVEYRRCS